MFLAVASMLCVPMSADAQRYLTEDFEYNVGDLYGQGGWLYHGAGSKTNTISVAEGNLTYAGYQDEEVGNCVGLQDVTKSYSLQEAFSDTQISSGSVYCSMLINVTSVGDENYFACFVRGSDTGITDKSNGMDVGRIMLTADDTDETKYKIGISRTRSSQVDYASESLELNKTYLVVMKHEFVDGDNNDIISIWVNPTDFVTEPTALANTASHTCQDVPSIQAIKLAQNSMSRGTYPVLTVDAIHVAGSWSSLFENGTTSIQGVGANILNGTACVYDMSGRMVLSGVNVNENSSLNGILHPGVYIIKQNSKAVKVVVK